MIKTKVVSFCALVILLLIAGSTVKANQIVDEVGPSDDPHFFPGGPTDGYLIWGPDWGWTHTFSFGGALPPKISSIILEIRQFGVLMYDEHEILLDGVSVGFLDNGFPYETSHTTTFILDPADFANLLVDGTANMWLDIDYPHSVAIYWSRLTINYIPAGLDHIEVSGPTMVDEDSDTQYQCRAYFVVGGVTTSSDVTSSVSWSDDSPFASIDSGGVLTTSFVSSDEPVQIKAAFGDKTDTHNITITNVLPTVSISATTPLASEPGFNGIFEISLEESAKETVRIFYNTDKTVSNPATPGADYMTLGGYVDFLPGETSTAISVVVIDDDLEEPTEIVKVNLQTDLQYIINPSSSSATVTISDDDGTAPESSGHIPEPDSIQVARDTIIQVHITDEGSGLENVTIFIENDLIYDGAPGGVYDSTGNGQAVEGICRSVDTGAGHLFVFQASELFDYEQKIDVEVIATDDGDNKLTDKYSFYTLMRTFGPNIKVNTDTGTFMQNHPATTMDSKGSIWVVWEHTVIAGDTDIYIGELPEGDSVFKSSMPVISNTNDQRNPAIATYGNKIFVVWQDKRNGNWDIYLSSSNDDGKTWAEIMVNEPEDGQTNPVSNQVNPAIAIDQNGKVYVVWQDDEAGNQDIYIADSSNDFISNLRITYDTSDQTEPVVSNILGFPYIIWTDARGTNTDIFRFFGIETALVDTPSDQSSPSVVISGSTLHLLWVDDENGFDDIFYGNDALGLLIDDGTSIIDEPGTIQSSPSIAANSTKVFACWQDSRNVSGNADTDIYYAERSGTEFGTNILVNDDIGTYIQTAPVISTEKFGNPYMVWVDNREGNNDIYAAAATSVGPVLATENVNAGSGGIVEGDINPNNPRSGVVDHEDDVIIEIPAGALQVYTTVTIRELNNPPDPPPGAFGVYYEFSPSGLEFLQPVTITIPHAAADCPGHSAYNVYFYDPTIPPPGLPWSREGITNVQHLTVLQDPSLPSDVHAIRFKTTHFTAFGAGGSVPGAAGGGGGGGGGCSVSAGGEGNIVEFLLPYIGFIIVLVILTVRDARVRKARSR